MIFIGCPAEVRVLAHRKLHPSPPVKYPLTKPVNECTSTVSAIKSKPGTNQDAIIEITVFEKISTIILNKSGHKILDIDLNRSINAFHFIIAFFVFTNTAILEK
jgi:hypothetical protein